MYNKDIAFFVDWLYSTGYNIYTKRTNKGTVYEAENKKDKNKIAIFASSPSGKMLFRLSKDGGVTKQDFDNVNEAIRYLKSENVVDTKDEDLSLSEHTDTVQLIREDIKGEYDAIKMYEGHVQIYSQLKEQTQNSVYDDLIKITKDIIQEEYTHVGELNELLNKVNPVEMDKFEEGVQEAQEKLNSDKTTQEDVKDAEGDDRQDRPTERPS